MPDIASASMETGGRRFNTQTGENVHPVPHRALKELQGDNKFNLLVTVGNYELLRRRSRR